MSDDNLNKPDEFKIGYNGGVVMTLPSQNPYKNGVYHTLLSTDGQEGKESIIRLQVNSASITRARNVPTLTSYFTPFNESENTVKSQIQAGYGTVTFSGQLDFDLTNKALDLLTENENNELLYGSMFSRDSIFHIQLNDGEKTLTMCNCVWNSFSINCQVNSLITASLSFQSNNGYQNNLIIKDDSNFSFSENIDIDDEQNPEGDNDDYFSSSGLLIPYWNGGVWLNNGKKTSHTLTSFNVSFERNVTPVFLNSKFVTASYLRPGLINVNLNASYVDYPSELTTIDNSISDEDSSFINVKIGSKIIKFNRSILVNQTYNMASMNDSGEKTFQFNSIRLDNTKPIFTIQ